MHEVFGQADFLELSTHVIDGLAGRFHAGGRRRDNDSVAALDRHHRLVHRRSGRIGRGRNGAHEANRLGVFGEAKLFVFFDDADGLHAQQIAQGAEGLALFLGDLVGHVAELGVLHRQFGKLLCMRGIVERPGQRGDCLIDTRLIGVGEACLRRAAAPHQLVNHGHRLRIGRRFHCDSHLSLH